MPLVLALISLHLVANLTAVSVASDDDAFRRWLSHFDAEMLFASFKEEGFTTVQEVVDARLTEEDLKELGIKKMKTRKAVFHALELVRDGKAAPFGGDKAASDADPSPDADPVGVRHHGRHADGAAAAPPGRRQGGRRQAP